MDVLRPSGHIWSIGMPWLSTSFALVLLSSREAACVAGLKLGVLDIDAYLPDNCLSRGSLHEKAVSNRLATHKSA